MNKRRCYSWRCNFMQSMLNRYRVARQPFSTVLWQTKSWIIIQRCNQVVNSRRSCYLLWSSQVWDPFPALNKACQLWRKMSYKELQRRIKISIICKVAIGRDRQKMRSTLDYSIWTNRNRKSTNVDRICSNNFNKWRTWTLSLLKAKTSQSSYRLEVREDRSLGACQRMEASGKLWLYVAI